MARRKSRGDPAVRQEMLEIAQQMARYVTMCGGPPDYWDRRIGLLQSGRAIKCTIRDLPGGIVSSQVDDLLVVRVSGDGIVEAIDDYSR